MSFLKGIKKIISTLRKEHFFLIASLTLIVTFLSSLGIYIAEYNKTGSSIRTVWDGIWWAVVTLCTVGYGDKFPVSDPGKFVALGLMVSGVVLLSLITGTIASVFVEQKIKAGKGLETIKEKNHIVVCGWNQYAEESLLWLNTYGYHDNPLIVFINELSIDEMDSLKLKYKDYNLKFLRGNYAYEDVLLRANIQRARFIILMADFSGEHANKDRVDERTILAALTIKSLAPKIKITAELLEGSNRPHLVRASVDEIIVRGEHTGSLLASAATYAGLPQVFNDILSVNDQNNLKKEAIPAQFIGKTFEELTAFYRKEKHAILLGILQEKKAMKLEDMLTDDSSIIDTFIKEKIRESKKDLFFKKDTTSVLINPDNDYIIGSHDYAVLLCKI